MLKRVFRAEVSRSRNLLPMLAVAVLCSACSKSETATQPEAMPQPGTVAKRPSIEGTPIVPATADSDPEYLSIGKEAPQIEGEDINGESFKLSDYRGKVVLLDFWGNW